MLTPTPANLLCFLRYLCADLFSDGTHADNNSLDHQMLLRLWEDTYLFCLQIMDTGWSVKEFTNKISIHGPLDLWYFNRSIHQNANNSNATPENEGEGGAN